MVSHSVSAKPKAVRVGYGQKSVETCELKALLVHLGDEEGGGGFEYLTQFRAL